MSSAESGAAPHMTRRRDVRSYLLTSGLCIEGSFGVHGSYSRPNLAEQNYYRRHDPAGICSARSSIVLGRMARTGAS